MGLELLELEEKDLRERLSVNLSAQREIKTEKFLKKYGIQIGDIIEFMDGRTKKTGVFNRIIYNLTEPVNIVIRLLKKDGTEGKMEVSPWVCHLDMLRLVRSQDDLKTII